MANSRASWLALALLAGAAASAAVAPGEPATPAAPAAAELACDQSAPIRLDAKSTDVDYKNSALAFHAVRITQGECAIEADDATATGLDFKASQWVFRGNVKITTPDGSIASDEARINFVANSIADAQISGSPAVFEQRREKRTARGRAAHIEYDFAKATVRLSDGATLSDGEREISGRTLVYDMRQQRLRANPDEQDGGPVTFIINPHKPDAKPKP